ncbi:MAG: hypothetical protein K8R54_02595 [Bacteroidales bacterium]|nr:hypothetical protein [Bacteroidales bacterium]
MKPIYNFPYFGAGKASYFDRAFVEVVFKEEPNKEQKKLIEKNVPFPIAEISWKKNFMTAGSGQFAHVDIATTYQTKDGLDPEDEENWEDNRWFFASGSQVDAFNTDIEKWFNEIHNISSIFLALRGEDYESGGTEFSDWHKWSLKQIKSILPYFDDVVADYDYDSEKASIIQSIFYMTEDTSKFDSKYVNYLHPGKIEFEAFEKGNIEPLKNISNSNYAEETIKAFNEHLKKKHKKNIIKYADVFLGFESVISKNTFKKLNELLFIRLKDVYSETFKKVAKNITDINFVDRIAGKGHNLTAGGKYKKSIKLFEKALSVPVEANVRSGLYTNALWVFQKDNTGLPVNKKRNKLALEKCIPKGAEYPAVFFNACCIYTEMEEYDKAYEMIQEAIAHYYDKKYMINEIKNEDMFKEFREKTDVLGLLKNYNPEPIENPKPRFIGESIAYDRFDIHNIYNRGYAVKFVNILLFNGHINTTGEFNNTCKELIDSSSHSVEGKTLVIVNGNLSAKSISEYDDVCLLVMGKINCKNITNKEVIEKGKTNFDYIPYKLKKHDE